MTMTQQQQHPQHPRWANARCRACFIILLLLSCAAADLYTDVNNASFSTLFATERKKEELCGEATETASPGVETSRDIIANRTARPFSSTPATRQLQWISVLDKQYWTTLSDQEHLIDDCYAEPLTAATLGAVPTAGTFGSDSPFNADGSARSRAKPRVPSLQLIYAKEIAKEREDEEELDDDSILRIAAASPLAVPRSAILVSKTEREKHRRQAHEEGRLSTLTESVFLIQQGSSMRVPVTMQGEGYAIISFDAKEGNTLSTITQLKEHRYDSRVSPLNCNGMYLTVELRTQLREEEKKQQLRRSEPPSLGLLEENAERFGSTPTFTTAVHYKGKMVKDDASAAHDGTTKTIKRRVGGAAPTRRPAPITATSAPIQYYQLQHERVQQRRARKQRSALAAFWYSFVQMLETSAFCEFLPGLSMRLDEVQRSEPYYVVIQSRTDKYHSGGAGAATNIYATHDASTTTAEGVPVCEIEVFVSQTPVKQLHWRQQVFSLLIPLLVVFVPLPFLLRRVDVMEEMRIDVLLGAWIWAPPYYLRDTLLKYIHTVWLYGRTSWERKRHGGGLPFIWGLSSLVFNFTGRSTGGIHNNSGSGECTRGTASASDVRCIRRLSMLGADVSVSTISATAMGAHISRHWRQLYSLRYAIGEFVWQIRDYKTELVARWCRRPLTTKQQCRAAAAARYARYGRSVGGSAVSLSECCSSCDEGQLSSPVMTAATQVSNAEQQLAREQEGREGAVSSVLPHIRFPRKVLDLDTPAAHCCEDQSVKEEETSNSSSSNQLERRESQQKQVTITIAASEEDDKWCRICREDESEGALVAPCSCIGSVRWSHRDCLDHWRIEGMKRNLSHLYYCEICSQPYIISIQRRTLLLQCSYDILRLWLLLATMAACLGLITTVSYSVIGELSCTATHHEVAYGSMYRMEGLFLGAYVYCMVVVLLLFANLVVYSWFRSRPDVQAYMFEMHTPPPFATRRNIMLICLVSHILLAQVFASGYLLKMFLYSTSHVAWNWELSSVVGGILFMVFIPPAQEVSKVIRRFIVGNACQDDDPLNSSSSSSNDGLHARRATSGAHLTDEPQHDNNDGDSSECSSHDENDDSEEESVEEQQQQQQVENDDEVPVEGQVWRTPRLLMALFFTWQELSRIQHQQFQGDITPRRGNAEARASPQPHSRQKVKKQPLDASLRVIRASEYCAPTSVMVPQ